MAEKLHFSHLCSQLHRLLSLHLKTPILGLPYPAVPQEPLGQSHRSFSLVDQSGRPQKTQWRLSRVS
uniref:Uncharacterized protein n=1 Tax=Knipowitschia caucasica TaxID=637954 RepID=A0AAV2LE21_KNICA